MFYDASLTIPANTPQATPVELEVKLTYGVITHAEVEFAPGCHGMVYAYIRYGLHQLWPTDPGQRFHSDGRSLVWDEYYELFDEPFSVIVGGYSPGTSYDHTIIFRFEVTPQEIAERGATQGSILAKIGRLLGIS
jgi:hypothetical protein